MDPFGDVDLISRPTINHQWLLDQKLDEAKEGFVIFAEINLPGDDASSLIYAANVEPENRNPYTLLNLLGHSGGSETDGELNYEIDSNILEKDIVDRILVKVRWSS